MVKKVVGWFSVAIFAAIVLFYIEGFVFYSFKGNLGFLLSLFIGPIGLILGFIGRNESKPFKVFGFFGNIAVIAFSFLYWPIGYIIEWLINKVL